MAQGNLRWFQLNGICKFEMKREMNMQKTRSRYEMDMTEGPLLGKILRFAIPVLLTSFLQLLYNAADTVVVGRFAGATALAAVGSTGALNQLIVTLFTGMSIGTNVVVARHYGAGEHKDVSEAVHTSVALAIVGGVFIGVVGCVICRPLLLLMGSPEDVIELATLYMRINFIGMPANLLATFGAAILRGVGDTKRPLTYLLIAGVVNVALNLVMVCLVGLDVEGVAIATVASQVISAILVITCLIRSDSSIRLNLRSLRIHREQMRRILQVGLPAGLQGSLFSISNVLIQSSVNSFSTIPTAGNSIAGSLEGFVYTSMNSVHQAALTFASQNLGAGKIRRVRRSVWVCLGTVTVIGLVMGNLFLLFGRPLLSIYNNSPEVDALGMTVIDYGMKRLMYMMPLYCLCGLMDVIVGSLRGVGYSIMPMIVSLTGACLFRVVWIYTVFAANHTLDVLYLSYPISWALTFGVHMLCYAFAARPKLLQLEKRIAAAADGQSA